MKKRKCITPRGKVLGGSSTINAKMYVRGNKKDFELWNNLGNKGWSYKKVLPYFIKSENSTIRNRDHGYHGTNGLLHVQYAEPSEFTSSILCGERELGMPIADYNGQSQIGVSPVQFTIDGTRAFINTIKRRRRNVNITLRAFVTKVVISRKKLAARGVEFIKDRKKYRVWARKEVIISAGTYNSPQILMLSGIGPKKQLQKHNIKPLHYLPVGYRLQEHPAFLGFFIRTNKTIPKKSLKESIRSYLRGHRPLTTPMNLDSVVFTNLNSTGASSDIETFFIVPPGFGDRLGPIFNFNSKITKSIKKNYDSTRDLIVVIVLLRPKSKGKVTLKSKNPKDFPIIDFKLFTDSRNIDIDTMYQGIRKTFELLETSAFKALNATFIPIDAGCGHFHMSSKTYWHCMIKHMTATLHHPIGTTRMGTSSRTSVVSNHLKVHGIAKLRVIDAGVMPSMPSGNTNAVVYMIAEKAADLIKRYYKRG